MLKRTLSNRTHTSSHQNTATDEFPSSSVTNSQMKKSLTPAQGMDQQRMDDPMQCKICLQLFNEPYSTLCGHTFCRICITHSLQFSAQCPICETNLDAKRARKSGGGGGGSGPNGGCANNNIMLTPNYAVASMVEQKRTTNRLYHSISDVVIAEENGENGPGTASEHHSMSLVDDGQAERAIMGLLNAGNHQMSLESLERIQETLHQKRLELELNDKQVRALMLHDFLDRMIEKREQTARLVHAELDALKQDRQRVRASLCSQHSGSSLQRLVPDSSSSGTMTTSSEQQTSNPAGDTAQPFPHHLAQLRQRMLKHTSNLESAYFAQQQLNSSAKAANASQKEQKTQDTLGSVAELDDFAILMKNIYKYGDVKVLATLNYNLEACNQPSIVSSIEFDKDGDFFVVAGVTKMIKLYDYNAMMDNCLPDRTSGNPGVLHQPIVQLKCNSKISNISWNPYNKTMLASSDYDGTVQLWDTTMAKCTRIFEEHEKRCWTVQFNNIDPHLMASGSDDGKVKLWSVMCPQSLCAIDAKVNVCCVYFSPKLRNQLVFGSSDHCVHLYDLRQLAKPLNVFRGHRKAVSYVKYVNENEVVSASTDSNLRLWDVNTGKCLQTMRGHQNEKNFVGLATDGTHVVCGSENNHLYLYYKSIADPLLSFDFGQRCVVDPLSSSPVVPSSLVDSPASDFSLGNPSGPTWPTSSVTLDAHNTITPSTSAAAGGGVSGDFVSAVCWRRNSNIILAANSQGQTYVLQLQ